jgi:hypothetical protein
MKYLILCTCLIFFTPACATGRKDPASVLERCWEAKPVSSGARSYIVRFRAISLFRETIVSRTDACKDHRLYIEPVSQAAGDGFEAVEGDLLAGGGGAIGVGLAGVVEGVPVEGEDEYHLTLRVAKVIELGKISDRDAADFGARFDFE